MIIFVVRINYYMYVLHMVYTKKPKHPTLQPSNRLPGLKPAKCSGTRGAVVIRQNVEKTRRLLKKGCRGFIYRDDVYIYIYTYI